MLSGCAHLVKNNARAVWDCQSLQARYCLVRWWQGSWQLLEQHWLPCLAVQWQVLCDSHLINLAWSVAGKHGNKMRFDIYWNETASGQSDRSQWQLEGAHESAYLCQVKWFKHYYYYYKQLHPTTASQREGKVTAGVAVCAVCAMMSLLLWVIMYPQRMTEGQNDQTLKLFHCSLCSPWWR